MLVVSMYALWKLLHGIEALTGLDFEGDLPPTSGKEKDGRGPRPVFENAK